MCDESDLEPEDRLWAVLWWMSAGERRQFAERFAETWCMGCGEAPHAGPCPFMERS